MTTGDARSNFHQSKSLEGQRLVHQRERAERRAQKFGRLQTRVAGGKPRVLVGAEARYCIVPCQAGYQQSQPLPHLEKYAKVSVDNLMGTRGRWCVFFRPLVVKSLHGRD